MRYRLTVVPGQFFDGWQFGIREFSADTDTDAEAIQHAEAPPRPLKFIVPGEGTCDSFPRKLEELRGISRYRPVRTVKEWP